MVKPEETLICPRLNFTEDIKVLVGPERTPFTIPKALFSKRSPFFAAAVSERWGKSKDGPVLLHSAALRSSTCIYLASTAER